MIVPPSTLRMTRSNARWSLTNPEPPTWRRIGGVRPTVAATTSAVPTRGKNATGTSTKQGRTTTTSAARRAVVAVIHARSAQALSRLATAGEGQPAREVLLAYPAATGRVADHEESCMCAVCACCAVVLCCGAFVVFRFARGDCFTYREGSDHMIAAS